MTEEELLDAKASCCLIGGREHPIDLSTLWRGVKAGRYPQPIAISPNARRWRRSELVAALEELAAQRKGEAA